MPKGAELPISTMIILILGVLVLIAMLAMLMGVWKPAAGGASLQTVTTLACNRFVAAGCVDADQIAIGQDVTCGTSTVTADKSLSDLCTTCYPGSDCKKDVCKCI